MSGDLVPLPRWKQQARMLGARWRRSRDRRRRARAALYKTARRWLTLAVSLAGATLVAFGVYEVYPPAGWMIAGLLLWGVQWNYGDKEGDE